MNPNHDQMSTEYLKTRKQSKRGLFFYELLGVHKDATEDDVRRAFRKAALRVHPDRNPGYEEQFKAINKASSVLMDSKRRQLYDLLGSQGLDIADQIGEKRDAAEDSDAADDHDEFGPSSLFGPTFVAIDWFANIKNPCVKAMLFLSCLCTGFCCLGCCFCCCGLCPSPIGKPQPNGPTETTAEANSPPPTSDQRNMRDYFQQHYFGASNNNSDAEAFPVVTTQPLPQKAVPPPPAGDGEGKIGELV